MATTTVAELGPMQAPGSDREIVAVRVFDAPRELVWEACTRPEHVRRWYGPASMPMTSCEIDARVGGRFRYVFSTPNGEMAFSGEYLELDRPSRVVNTWLFEPMPGTDTVESATLEEHEGRTVLTVRATFQRPEHLQGWAESGGYAGMAEAQERLRTLVHELARAA
ncbi:MAG TPA: SRPBCC domain-containing protein [Longimicrobium sp.]|jgi:uncharacterized protein YndB with AHSA1/START domain|uniref:SRPBCC domain-containing protein n=1 Tax=Longimicrobium sp. TaxID=2029185 RepID=UPI002EDB479F